MTVLPFLIDVGSTLEDATGMVQYVLVFLFAAIPVVEILFVVPLAIGIGLDPILASAVAFVGNVLSVYLLIGFHRQLTRWWHNWRHGDTESADPTPRDSDRYARARAIWDRYGLPGVALGGPVLTGVHIATLVALLTGSSNRLIASWMTIGIAVWTVLLAAGSVFGFSLLGIV